MYIFFATAPRKVQVILLKVFPSGSEKLGATPLGVKYIWIFITIIYRRRWASSFSGRKAINFGRKWPVLFFHSVRTLVRRPISPWSIYCKIWLYFTDKYEFTDILIVFQSSKLLIVVVILSLRLSIQVIFFSYIDVDRLWLHVSYIGYWQILNIIILQWYKTKETFCMDWCEYLKKMLNYKVINIMFN